MEPDIKALWKFSYAGQERGVWNTVESPRKSAQTWPQWLESHHYEPLLAESIAILLPLTLYGRFELTEQNHSFEYVILLQLGSKVRPIGLPDLPSLLQFLQTYAPIRRPVKRGVEAKREKPPVRT
jgi:hypothetical protein